MIELVCPAGTPAALRTALAAGADCVYCGFADETNARNFPGLNFDRAEMERAVTDAHAAGARLMIAVNTYPRAGDPGPWRRALADAAALGADAVILADPGLLDRAATHHPDLRRHLSVQAAAANPDLINFYARRFGIRRVVLPRVLSVEEIAAINRAIDIETEAFVFGGLCVMAEGRCSLSSYATGRAPNLDGVCSPAEHVRYDTGQDGAQSARLGGFLIQRSAADTPVPYPTLCKGCFSSPARDDDDDDAGVGAVAGAAAEARGHFFEDPVSLDAAALIPALARAGVRALKIEGRQRSRAYVGRVVRAFRAARDAAEAALAAEARAGDGPAAGGTSHGDGDAPLAGGGGGGGGTESALAALAEGGRATTGAYRKSWR